ncbi:sortase [Glaciihabitans sp. dw_435]|uniref:sortase n=1 Tax=Glaciihabitans sp. dw_435 TaxID=2720081 RepID=UPI001BD61B8E|nr:sortase [Glaciihabitans sp. dw_435]
MARARTRVAQEAARKKRRDEENAAYAIEAANRPTSRSVPQLDAPEQFRLTGSILVALGLLLVGFAVQFAGISQVSYLRDQQLSFDDYRYQLANATAPVGQTGVDNRLLPMGTEVSVLDIDSIKLHAVVLEGTSSDVTQSGPGHRRDTPLPGQAGASVIVGRQSTYGAPFAAIGSLKKGDVITATTGQGVATYTVSGVRHTGDPLPAALAAGGGRLTLVSASGLPFLPNGIVRVDATLTTPAQASPGRVLTYGALDDDELTMAGNPAGWPMLLLGLIGLLVTLALMAISIRYWGRWQSWVVAVPVLLAIGCFTAQQASVILPNLL